MAVTVLLGLAASAALAGDEVPDGTRVSAVALGGMTRAEATARLERALVPGLESPVALVADGQVLTLDPAKAGLTLDVAATVDDALDVGPLDRLRAVLGAGNDVAPVASVDEAAMRAELAKIAAGFDRAPREGSVRFDDKAVPLPAPVPVLPLRGRALDVEGSAAAVRDAFPDRRVEVPVELTPVRTTAEDVQAAVREIALPAVAAPVTVTAPGGSVLIAPVEIAGALRIEASPAGELTPRLLPDVLYQRVRERLAVVGQAPVDASFRIEGGKPVLVPSRDGTSISPTDLAAAVGGVLGAPAPRTASAPLSPATARVTTARAKALGIVEPIATFTSRNPCCRPRVQNIHRIADLVDGYLVLPGEQFDLNGVVGPRDRGRGFVEAPQILEGEFVDRVGGGVSQFATTLFNAVFFSGLKDITHSPHSYYISRYPPGREATVSFPLPDLVFENDSPTGVLITTAYTGTSITVSFWGTRRFDEVRSVTGPRTRLRDFTTQYVQRKDCTASQGERGFDVVVTRVFVDGGRTVRREDFRTRYKAEPRFICGPPPAPRPAGPKPAPTPAPSASPAPPPRPTVPASPPPA